MKRKLLTLIFFIVKNKQLILSARKAEYKKISYNVNINDFNCTSTPAGDNTGCDVDIDKDNNKSNNKSNNKDKIITGAIVAARVNVQTAAHAAFIYKITIQAEV